MGLGTVWRTVLCCLTLGCVGGPLCGAEKAPKGGEEAPKGGEEAPKGGGEAPKGGEDSPMGVKRPPRGVKEAQTGVEEAPMGAKRPKVDAEKRRYIINGYIQDFVDLRNINKIICIERGVKSVEKKIGKVIEIQNATYANIIRSGTTVTYHVLKEAKYKNFTVLIIGRSTVGWVFGARILGIVFRSSKIMKMVIPVHLSGQNRRQIIEYYWKKAVKVVKPKALMNYKHKFIFPNPRILNPLVPSHDEIAGDLQAQQMVIFYKFQDTDDSCLQLFRLHKIKVEGCIRNLFSYTVIKIRNEVLIIFPFYDDFEIRIVYMVISF